MMILKNMLRKGITGFYDDNLKIDHKHINYDLFKKQCYELARKLRGEILFIDDVEFYVQRSFYIARIGEIRTLNEIESFDILINMYYPIIGFSKIRETEKLNIDFIDIPNVNEFLYDDYLALSKSQLEDEFEYNNKELNDVLYEYEIKQINYWKPRTLGDVIFNYWD